MVQYTDVLAVFDTLKFTVENVRAQSFCIQKYGFKQDTYEYCKLQRW